MNRIESEASTPAFPVGVDALPPLEIARKAETIGETKAWMRPATVFVLGILAGAFIALGAIFSTTVLAGGSALPYGVARLLAGAELFTGNNLIVMAWASRRIRTRRLLANWALVYAGNFVGALGTAVLVYAGRQYTFGGGEVGKAALSIATAKVDYGFGQAIALGVLCNGLVCLAVWLSYGARTVTDKILAVVPPIAAFVAAGFEHSVANMYFIPYGLLVERDTQWASSTSGLPDTSGLTWSAFFLDNLLPVTLGNIIGGSILVGAVYWFVYLRPSVSRDAFTRSSGAAPDPDV